MDPEGLFNTIELPVELIVGTVPLKETKSPFQTEPESTGIPDSIPDIIAVKRNIDICIILCNLCLCAFL